MIIQLGFVCLFVFYSILFNVFVCNFHCFIWKGLSSNTVKHICFSNLILSYFPLDVFYWSFTSQLNKIWVAIRGNTLRSKHSGVCKDPELKENKQGVPNRSWWCIPIAHLLYDKVCLYLFCKMVMKLYGCKSAQVWNV